MKRIYKIVLFLLICMVIFGCQKKEKGAIIPYDTSPSIVEISTPSEQDLLLDTCNEIYTAVYSNDWDTNKRVSEIVNGLGQAGYVAVDDDNQVNMTCAEKLLEFIRRKENGDHAQIILIRVSCDSGLSLYEFEAEDGKVFIRETYYKNMNGKLSRIQEAEYEASVFDFTEEGYLMIEGSWNSPDKYVLTLSEEKEHVALRVFPLDEEVRELNCKYIKPISYGLNNMFITEWSQEDYNRLDFYDVFEMFYEAVYKTKFPYVMSDNLSISKEYDIPSNEFEYVIMQHFQVTEQELRKVLRYDAKKDCYIYRPRGFGEYDYMDIPYAEVVSYTENEDGSLTLLVNAVYANENTSRLFSHEVTVKDIEGKTYYLSNHLIDAKEPNLWWHTERYTDEEREKQYESISIQNAETKEYQTEEDDISWMIPKVEVELFSKEEKLQVKNQVLTVAENIWGLYEDVSISESLSYESGINNFTKEQRMAVVSALGKNAVVATSEDINMVNGEKLKAFYQDYQNKKEGMITVYHVNRDGLIATVTFLYRDNTIQEYYVGVKPNKDGKPRLTGSYVQEIEFINLTEKGYFMYAQKNALSHASMCQYWRVSPLSKECRELTEKYLKYFDLQKYKLMVIDWDENNVSDVLVPGLFEDFYYMKYGENYKGDCEAIPATLFEEIMMTYLPVSIKQIRQAFAYNEIENTYCQETVYGSPYPPFLEVVDYKYHADGTITLYADGVWPDYNSDYAFTNVIVIQPFSDGTFRMLSNNVEQKELELPPVAHRTKEEN